ncbi:MAG: HAMP domain-containing histidine kinase [Lachnospiraceae bacterium]|nr:HAMP domain-containing histidine kinase [Lachnospiraceae bacterium]
MIRMLQKKFVVTAMAAVTVLLLFLLGTINVVNIAIVGKEVDKTLSMLAETEGEMGHIPAPPDSAPPHDFRVRPKDERDKFLSSNFFMVWFNERGQAVHTDVSRVPSVDEEKAKELALEAYHSGQRAGKAGKYRYQIKSARTGKGMVIVFLDTSEEILSYVRVLFLSVGIGLVCWLFMLALVIFLSKRAIRPIAMNFEKQKQFVTNAGHEIKTPLAIILANTEAMELYNGENKWTQNIRTQTVRLNGLMNSLLLLARMDEAAAQAEAVEFLLDELLGEMAQSFAELLEQKGIRLQLEIQSGIVIRADKEQIRQLISILFDNAAKYTKEGGMVYVSLKRKEKDILLQMKNNCESLPDAPPGKLFDRFYRGDAARTQKSGGYGIGLSLAHSIAQANKGSITARYEGTDMVLFTVTF